MDIIKQICQWGGIKITTIIINLTNAFYLFQVSWLSPYSPKRELNLRYSLMLDNDKTPDWSIKLIYRLTDLSIYISKIKQLMFAISTYSCSQAFSSVSFQALSYTRVSSSFFCMLFLSRFLPSKYVIEWTDEQYINW